MLTRLLPLPVKRIAKHIRREIWTIRAARYLDKRGVDVVRFAEHARYRAAIPDKRCAACGHKGPFKSFGNPPRWDAQCPQCHSLERHRFLAILLSEGLLPDDQDILHFAPEIQVGALLRRRARRYVTADLFEPADLKLDIEETGLPTGTFDVIVCSHILQYVDDTKALTEMRRILRPSGMMILMVPLVEGISTLENITKDSDYYVTKQRLYGSDLRDRIRDCGFSIKEHIASGKVAIENALIMGEKIFICTPATREVASAAE